MIVRDGADMLGLKVAWIDYATSITQVSPRLHILCVDLHFFLGLGTFGQL